MKRTFPSGFPCEDLVAQRRVAEAEVFPWDSPPSGEILGLEMSGISRNISESLDSIQQDLDIFTICSNVRNVCSNSAPDHQENRAAFTGFGSVNPA